MKYNVFYNAGNSQAIITRDGYGQAEDDNNQLAGSFEMKVDEINNQTSAEELSSHNGDHPFVIKAREILKDAGATDAIMERITFVDKSSNAPAHEIDLSIGTSTNDLPESEPGTAPNASSEKGGEVSTVGTDPNDTDPNGKTDKEDGLDKSNAENQREKDKQGEKQSDKSADKQPGK